MANGTSMMWPPTQKEELGQNTVVGLWKKNTYYM